MKIKIKDVTCSEIYILVQRRYQRCEEETILFPSQSYNDPRLQSAIGGVEEKCTRKRKKNRPRQGRRWQTKNIIRYLYEVKSHRNSETHVPFSRDTTVALLLASLLCVIMFSNAHLAAKVCNASASFVLLVYFILRRASFRKTPGFYILCD